MCTAASERHRQTVTCTDGGAPTPLDWIGPRRGGGPLLGFTAHQWRTRQRCKDMGAREMRETRLNGILCLLVVSGEGRVGL
ncbi:hypothetical protein DAI22_03g035550 [Oryza sativa Japonica Group]|nr:hypothetical protein DAI22_03g035550 [Oryza sativa Japonica Group]